jgi:hypothetical protein
MPVNAVRALSFHAAYACRHRGACCTARWPIPSRSGDLLPRTERGCVFHHAHRCSIQATSGHDALPVACQQFPRVSVIDPRGASVTLSCFCPTALSMLDEFDGPIAVVEQSGRAPEGLDARTSLPPALRPDVLMDWESWWEFERLAVEEFNRDDTPRQILGRLSAIVEEIRTWKPGEGPLIDRVHAAFAGRGVAGGGVGDHAALPATAPAHLAPEHPRTRLPAHRRFLACHAFANWTAHLGAGLRTWLRSLETVVFLLDEGWTIREIDEWLRHWADPRMLARVWSAAEKEKGRN